MSDNIYKRITSEGVVMIVDSKITENYVMDMSSRLHKLEKKTKLIHAGLVIMSILSVCVMIAMLGVMP